jgi:WD40 repeat protein
MHDEDWASPECDRGAFGPAQTLAAKSLGILANGAWISLIASLLVVIFWTPRLISTPTARPGHRARGFSPAPVVSFDIASDGQTIATANESGEATIWKPGANLRPERTLSLTPRATAVALLSQGRILALGGNRTAIALWFRSDDTWAPGPQIPIRSPSELKASPDGRYLAIASYDRPEIVLWDIAEHRAYRTLRGHKAPVIHMAFAPDGRSLASAAGNSNDRPVIVWDIDSGRIAHRISAPESAAQALAFAPDATRLAGACPHENAVSVWEIQTGAQVQVFAGHTQSTRSLAYSPDGKFLATGAGDGTAGLWSVATGARIKLLDCNADVVHKIAFTPDGRTLIATANDGDIRTWNVELLTKDWIDQESFDP